MIIIIKLTQEVNLRKNDISKITKIMINIIAKLKIINQLN